MPLTVDDARHIISQKASVNHGTYKQIYIKLEGIISRRASRGDTSLEYVVPPFVPGRPMYNIDHAVRYCKEKLQHNGFDVNIGDVKDVLLINWKIPSKKRPPTPLPPPPPNHHIPQPKPAQSSDPNLLFVSTGRTGGTGGTGGTGVQKSKVSATLSHLKQKLGIE